MRNSCSGCRVLRKGCDESCSIRPCLQWIKSSESQAIATLFLAKFYGRAGLINFISSGPPNVRPAIFRSLLYDACGRIVNPVSASAGLMCSGHWNLCESAVECVLNGSPIATISNFKAYDLRHVSKDSEPSTKHHRVTKNQARFKRTAHRTASTEPDAIFTDSKDETVEGSSVTEAEAEEELRLDLTLQLGLSEDPV